MIIITKWKWQPLDDTWRHLYNTNTTLDDLIVDTDPDQTNDFYSDSFRLDANGKQKLGDYKPGQSALFDTCVHNACFAKKPNCACGAEVKCVGLHNSLDDDCSEFNFNKTECLMNPCTWTTVHKPMDSDLTAPSDLRVNIHLDRCEPDP